MIEFGKYDQKVTFINFQNVSDGAGGTTPSPEISLSTFASVKQTNGKSGLESGEMVLPNTYTVRIQYRASFVPSELYQIYYRNRYYKITSVLLDEQRQHKEYIIQMEGIETGSYLPPNSLELIVEVWNSVNYILDADTSANIFNFTTDVFDPSNLWAIDKFIPNQTGNYRIEVNQPVKNNFSVGVQPKVPQIKNITTLQYTQATLSENWPTEYVNFNWIYDWTAQYNINVTTVGHQFQLQLFNYAEGEASMTQLGAPGIIKIYKIN